MDLGGGEQLLHNTQISPKTWISSRLLRRCRILGKSKVQVLSKTVQVQSKKVQVQSKKWSCKFRVEQSVPSTSRGWWGAEIQPSFSSSRCIWVRKCSDFMKMMVGCWFLIQCFTVRRRDTSFIGNPVLKWRIHFFKSKINLNSVEINTLTDASWCDCNRVWLGSQNYQTILVSRRWGEDGTGCSAVAQRTLDTHISHLWRAINVGVW